MIRRQWEFVEQKNESPSESKSRFLVPEKQELSLLDGRTSVEEASFELKEGKLALLAIAIWNKGDSEELTMKGFKQKVVDLTAALDTRLGVKGQDRGKDPRSASKAERIFWNAPQLAAQLEFSSTKSDRVFQGEFIRLRVAPPTKQSLVGGGGGLESGGVVKVARSTLSANVKKEPNGDVFVGNVPMADQGEKGYCAVATCQRVFNYYGIPCDQHDMAQAAGTEAGGGTNPEDMESALRRLQGRFKVHVRDLVHWDPKDYQRLISDYNRGAKKEGLKTYEDYAYVPLSLLNADVLRAVRLKGSGFDRFKKSIKDYVDRGVPLLWGLQLGLYPENGQKAKQSGGGHMRLIIGYNDAKNEVIFSDSWGVGHEFKRMAMPDAYAATNGLYIVEPSN